MALAALAASAQTTVNMPLKDFGTEPAADIAFSPDGKQLASVDVDGFLRLLNTATGTELSRTIGPLDTAYALAWSPTEPRIATGGQDLKVTIWDAVTLQKVREITVGGRVEDLAFSPDGVRIAAGAQDRLGVYEVASGEKVFEVSFTGSYKTCRVQFPSAGDRVMVARDTFTRFFAVPSGAEGITISTPCSGAADLSPDGTRIVIGQGTSGSSAQVKLWDATTGTKIADLFNGKVVLSARFLPDGSRIAFGLSGVGAIVTDASTGTELFALRPVPGSTTTDTAIGPIALSPDGRRLAQAFTFSWKEAGASSFNRKQARIALHGLASAEPVQVFPGIPSEPYRYEGGGFSPDGSRVALVGLGPTYEEVRGFDLAVGQGLYSLYGRCFAYTDDGARIATGGADGKIRVWDAATGRLLGSYATSGGGDYTSVAFSPDGTKILGASGNVYIWDVATGALLQALDPGISVWTDLTSLQYSPDGSQLLAVASDRDYKVCLWDVTTWGLQALPVAKIKDATYASGTTLLVCYTDKNYASLIAIATGAEQRRFEHSGRVNTVAVSPGLTRALTGSADGTMREWDLATGELLKTVDHSESVAAVAYSSDADRLLSCSGGSARIWEEAGAGPLQWIESRECWISRSYAYYPILAYSSDGTRVLTADGSQLRLWEVATGSLIRYFTSTEPVTAGAFSPDGVTLFSGHGSGKGRLWDAGTGALLRTLTGHTGSIVDAAFSPDGRSLLTGSADETARVWDVTTGGTVQTLAGGTSSVVSVAVSPDGKHAATGTSSNEAKLWDLETGQELRTYIVPSLAVGFTPDGSRFFSAGGTGVKLFNVETGVQELSFSPSIQVVSAEIAPDGRHLVLGGAASQHAQVLDLGIQPPSLLQTLWGTSGRTQVAVAPDGSSALTCGNGSGRAFLWATNFPPAQRNPQRISLGQAAVSMAQNLAYTDFALDLVGGQAANLVVRLTPAGGAGSWTLLGRRGAFPTVTVWDWRGEAKRDGTLEMVIPNPPPGTLYIAVYYSDPAGGAAGQFDLLVTAVDRYLSAISPSSGGNAGTITARVSGAEFSEGVEVELRRSGSVLKRFVPAYIDPASLTVSLDLRGLAPGTADVAVVWPDQSSLALTGAFEITSGGAGILDATLVFSEMVRGNRPATVWIEYENIGTADMPAPLFTLTSDENIPMRLGTDEAWVRGPVQVLGIDFQAQGTAGVLTPGRRQSIPVQVMPEGPAHAKIHYHLYVMDPASAAPVDWGAQEESFRPPLVDSGAWAQIWPLFTGAVGSTWAHYGRSLSETASYLSSQGRYVSNPARLLNAVMGHATGRNLLTPLFVTVDAQCPAPGLLPNITRRYDGNIEARYTPGPFGRGWTHYLDARLSELPNGYAVVRNGSSPRFFMPLSGGVFAGLYGDGANLRKEGGEYILTELDGSVSQFRSDGLPASMTDLKGNRLDFHYDARGGLERILHSSGGELTFSWSGAGRVERLTDCAGSEIVYGYDPSGEYLETVTGPDGRAFRYTYDKEPASPSLHALKTVVLPDGTVRSFDYDGAGRLSGMSLGDGGPSAKLGYDLLGRISMEDAGGAKAVASFDERGRITRFTDPLGNTSRLSYDASGNLALARDPSGAIFQYAYGTLGNLVQTVDPVGGKAVYEYTYPGSGGGFLSAIEDPLGNRSLFEVDSDHAMAVTTYPDGSEESVERTPSGLVSSFVNRRGQEVSLEYDARGLVTRKVLPDGTEVTYAHDALGNLLAQSGPAGTTLLEYDASGFLSKATDPSGHWFSYSHDSAGRLTRLEGDDGFALVYAYDASGRISGITDGSGADLATYHYDAADRLSREDKGNGTYSAYTYDAAGRLAKVENLGPGGILQSSYSVTFNAAGEPLAVAGPEGTVQHCFDPAGQLTCTTYPDGRSIQYQYDLAGNRLLVTDGPASTEYEVNALNQVTGAGEAAFAYDADGNLISKTDESGTTTFEYNSESQLVKVVHPGLGVFEYTYDAFGNRLTETRNGELSRFVYEPYGMVLEYDASGSLKARYIQGLGMLARIGAAGDISYFDFDPSGNTVALTDPAGAVAATYRYDPYGNPLQQTGSPANPYRWLGRYGVRADDHGLLLMGLRYYDPQVGRFCAVDPLRYQAGLNLYEYAGNNPVLYMDPSGAIKSWGGVLWKCVAPVVGPFSKALKTVLGLYNGSNNVKKAIQSAIDCAKKGDMGGFITALGKFDFAALQLVAMTSLGAVELEMGILGTLTFAEFMALGGAFLFVGETMIETYTDILDMRKTPSYYAPVCPNPYRQYNEIYHGKIPPEVQKILDERWPPHHVTYSGDPNEKLGPQGTGAGKWVPLDSELAYTVHFENMPTASAPAQEVFVTDLLSPDLDLGSLRLTEIGWGSHSVTISSAGLPFASRETVPDYRPEVQKNWWVDVSAELKSTGELKWTFRTLDPETGDLPEDAAAGFLPPNDSSGRGEGWVSFAAKPSSGAANGTRITNLATIVFDLNPPIDTNEVVNTLGMPPVSASIGGMVFIDNNEDGIHNCQEPGTPGVVVTVAGADASYNVMADGAGTFLKEDLGLGDYSISVDPKDPHLPSGATLTTGNNPIALSVVEGQAIRNVDFGFKAAAQIPGDCNKDGVVKINELMQVVAAYHGQTVGTCGADCDGSGVITIAELMRVVAAYHGQSVRCP